MKSWNKRLCVRVMIVALFALAPLFGSTAAFGEDSAKPGTFDLSVQVTPPRGIEIKSAAWANAVVEVKILTKAGESLRGVGGGTGGLLDANGVAKLKIALEKLPDEDCTVVVRIDATKSFPYAGEVTQSVNRNRADAIEQPLALALKSDPDGAGRLMRFQLVSGTTGKPISDHRLRLFADGSQLAGQEAKTDSQGVVTFDIRRNAKYHLATYESEGEEPLPTSQALVQFAPSGAVKEPIVVTTRRTVATVQFVVRDGKTETAMTHANNPVLVCGTADEVLVSPASASNGNKEYAARVTPKGGQLVLYDNTPPGVYRVELDPGVKAYSNYVVTGPAEFRIVKAGPPVDARLVLRKKVPQAVDVTVKDVSRGTDVAGAQVHIVGTDEPSGVARTDEQGRAHFTDVDEGPREFEISAAGFRAERISVVLPSTQPIAFSLLPLRTLTIRIMGGQHPGNKVVIVQRSDRSPSEFAADIEANGTAKIELVVDGPAILLVVTEKGIAHSERISMAGDQTVNVGPLPELAMAAGRIQTPGEGSLRQIIFVEKSARVPGAKAGVGKDGAFSVNVVPGKYMVYGRIERQYVLLGELDVPAEGVKGAQLTLREDAVKQGKGELDILDLPPASPTSKPATVPLGRPSGSDAK